MGLGEKSCQCRLGAWRMWPGSSGSSRGRLASSWRAWVARTAASTIAGPSCSYGRDAVRVWTLWRNSARPRPVAGAADRVVALLSAAHLYPFTARLLVFLQPSLLLAIAAGAATCRRAALPDLVSLALGRSRRARLSTRPRRRYLRTGCSTSTRSSSTSQLTSSRAMTSTSITALVRRSYYYAGRSGSRAIGRMGPCSVGNRAGYLARSSVRWSRSRVGRRHPRRAQRDARGPARRIWIRSARREAFEMRARRAGPRALVALSVQTSALPIVCRPRQPKTFPVPRGLFGVPIGRFACYGVGLPDKE